MNRQIRFPQGDTFFNRKRNVLEWGAKEFEIVRPHLRQHRTCLDIGGHCGITTIRYADHFDEVHSFEPILHEYLSANTKHLPNVTVHGCAISDKAGTIEMYPNPINSGGGIIPDEHNTCLIDKRYEGANAQMPNVKKVVVECTTLDQFQFAAVDFIKIDVEGHTLPVMQGMTETLANNAPLVQIEMSAFDAINKPVHAIFCELGYSIFGKYGKHDLFYHKEH